LLTWAIILLVLGIGLVVLEVLLPSGGLIGLMAAAVLVASVVFGFKHSSVAGVVILVVLVIFVPSVIVLGFKALPHTRVGRKLMLIRTSKALSRDRGVAGVSDQDYDALLGKTGRTVTPLRPSGIAEIDDQRYSVVSKGEMIDDSTDIVVVKIEGNSIVVEQKTT